MPNESLRTDSVLARPRQRRGAGRSYIERVNTYVLVTSQTSKNDISGGARRPASATRCRASRYGRTPSSPGYATTATPGTTMASASTFAASTSIARTRTCRVTRLDHLETRPSVRSNDNPADAFTATEAPDRFKANVDAMLGNE